MHITIIGIIFLLLQGKPASESETTPVVKKKVRPNVSKKEVKNNCNTNWVSILFIYVN